MTENLPAGWHIQGEQPAASDGDGGRSYQAALEHQARKRGEDVRAGDTVTISYTGTVESVLPDGLLMIQRPGGSVKYVDPGLGDDKITIVKGECEVCDTEPAVDGSGLCATCKDIRYMSGGDGSAADSQDRAR